MINDDLWKTWPPRTEFDRTDEFFPGVSELPVGLNRRQFLSLAAASLAAAGLSGCTKAPFEKIIPYVETPEGMEVGHPQFFATGWSIAGQSHGLLIENHLGRPTKIEGNPLHPASLGKASSIHQSLLLSLYDENRKFDCTYLKKKSSWKDFFNQIQELRQTLASNRGKGLYILSEITNSPSLAHQMFELKKTYPELKLFQYEPLSLERVSQACRKVFGRSCAPIYSFDSAELVISIDANIFGSPLYPLSYVHDFFERRKSGARQKLFVIEPTPSITGAWTKDRIVMSTDEIEEFCRSLNLRLSAGAKSSENSLVEKIAQAVFASPSKTLFIAGPHQPNFIHELVLHLNSRFAKNVVTYKPEADHPIESLEVLSADLAAGAVEALFIFGGNPAYCAPRDLALKTKIKLAKKSFYFSLTKDETSSLCHWNLPLAHPFEAWADSEAFDSSVSVHQPVIAPLFSGKNTHEIISILLGHEKSSYEIVKDFWQNQFGKQFSEKWPSFLKNGVLPQRNRLSLSPKEIFKIPAKVKAKHTDEINSYETLLREDPNVWDGRFSSNNWLQELPKVLTQLTWGNAAIISPKLAREKKIAEGQIIEIKTNRGIVKAPALCLPGQADRSITLSYGYGRTSASQFIDGLGYDAYVFLGSDRADFIMCEIRVTNDFEKLATTQTHHSMDGKDLVRIVSSDSESVPRKKVESLYPQNPTAKDVEQWGMVIDLDSCIGCNACISACQSENNIPVVGKQGVLNGREMHWIRVDRYFSGDENNPSIFFQPVPCMHCEKAPCEEVCPVAATVHSTDGLNQMIYNRCVGTRYCANNCPYKVRRFNFFSFTSDRPEILSMMQNPEVSVRPRGVMEKCTYCVQKISKARVDASKEQRPIRDGEVKTACEATCPSQAITFGNQNDQAARVSILKNKSRNYALLEELGTRPRTTYLAKISRSENA